MIAGRKLAEVGAGRENNLNAIRLVAAIMVIGSHSVPLTCGPDGADVLSHLTGEVSFGGLAVGFFLLMGGYLIAASVEHRKTFRSFFHARCSRIFPELAFVVATWVFLLGPVFSNLALLSYFSSSATWRYLLNAILIPVHNLPGVFEDNVYPMVVNGSLWILPIEFFCYVVAFCLYKCGLMRKDRYWIVLAVAALTSVVFFGWLHPAHLLVGVALPIALFAIGVGAYIYRDAITMNLPMAIAFLVCFCALLAAGLYAPAMLIFLPYPFFYIAFATRHHALAHSSIRENSYGLYLWGWPVEQALVLFSHNTIGWLWLTILATPIAFACGLAGALTCERIIRFASNSFDAKTR